MKMYGDPKANAFLPVTKAVLPDRSSWGGSFGPMMGCRTDCMFVTFSSRSDVKERAVWRQGLLLRYGSHGCPI
jgi:hypothetical protein